MDLAESIAIVGLLLLSVYLYVQLVSTKVYRFYRPTCPACVQSQAEWDSFKSACLFKTIKPIDVNMDLPDDPNAALYKFFNVQGVPTFVKVTPNGMFVTYEGDRTAALIMAWASS
jgi:hypothetical protein